jgi:hypothetical protein
MSLTPDLQAAIKNMLRESLNLKLKETAIGYDQFVTIELWIDDQYIDEVEFAIYTS